MRGKWERRPVSVEWGNQCGIYRDGDAMCDWQPRCNDLDAAAIIWIDVLSKTNCMSKRHGIPFTLSLKTKIGNGWQQPVTTTCHPPRRA